MKKFYALLTLFLLSFVSGHAQTMLSDYHTCDDNNDGIAPFDLTAKTDEMLFVLNSAEYTFSYYRSLSNAQGNVNAIATPDFFLNTTNPQQVFARATNVQTLENFYFSFVLNVDSPPNILGQATLTFCSETELPLYNLYDAVPQLVGNQQGLTFTFFDHATENLIDSNDAYNFVPTTVPLQQIDVMIENQCPQIVLSSITLHTNDCAPPQPCPAPMGLSASNVTENSVKLNWMSQPVAMYQIYVTPAGAPSPLPTTAPTGVTQVAPFTMNGLIPNTCYAFYVRSACNPSGTNNFSDWVGPFNFCTVPSCQDNAECPDQLALIAFVDTNNNGIKDEGETPFNMGSFAYQINDSGNTLYGHSNSGNPFRIFDSNPNNLYDLNFIINLAQLNYFSCPTTYQDVQIPAGGGSHNYYFPVIQVQPYTDLSVSLVPSGLPRPGFPFVNYIKYKNNGLQTVASGSIGFIKDDAVSIASVIPVPNNPLSNGFIANFTNLAPGEERTIIITMQVPTIPTISLGQTLTGIASIDNLAGADAIPADNNATLIQPIVGSYDPNHKTEVHGGKVAMDVFPYEEYLTYTIEFENTGTASATFVRVEDLLDTGLNPDSVEMVRASHPYNMRRIGNKLIWNFYNINLPTTASNPAQSHGYIQFKVKPTAGYTVGTRIPNTADIYFDYNPAIVTDVFETLFVATLSNDVFSDNNFYMVPNPAKNRVRLGWNDTAQSIEHVEIRDILGKSVFITKANSNETIIDVSPFSKGIYFVELTTKNQLKTVKKLIVD